MTRGQPETIFDPVGLKGYSWLVVFPHFLPWGWTCWPTMTVTAIAGAAWEGTNAANAVPVICPFASRSTQVACTVLHRSYRITCCLLSYHLESRLYCAQFSQLCKSKNYSIQYKIGDTSHTLTNSRRLFWMHSCKIAVSFTYTDRGKVFFTWVVLLASLSVSLKILLSSKIERALPHLDFHCYYKWLQSCVGGARVLPTERRSFPQSIEEYCCQMLWATADGTK